MTKQHSPKAAQRSPTPKTKRPWDIPSFPSLGDLDPDITYRAVGEALTLWEKFEREMAGIYSILVAKQPRHSPAMRAYGAILTSRGRIDLLKAASEAVFVYAPNRELRLRFKAILESATEFSVRRNEIAHGIVMRYRNLRSDPKSYVLAPNYLSTHKMKFPSADKCEAGEPGELRAVYAYSSSEIGYFSGHFQGLRTEAATIASKLQQHVSATDDHAFRSSHPAWS